MKKSIAFSLTAILAASLISVNAGTAIADETPTDQAVIAEAAPDIAAAAHDATGSAGDTATYATDGGHVHVSTDGETAVTLTDGQVTRTVVLPTTDDAYSTSDADGIRVVQNSDGTKSAVAVADDFVSLITILQSTDAPTTYSYDYSAYGSLRQAADGSVTIWDGAEEVGYLLNPWARDANGTSVPTRYEVSGDTVVQVVDHRAGSYVYPIVADPTYTFPRSNDVFSRIVEDRNAATAAVTLHVYVNPNLNIPTWRIPRATLESKYNEIVAPSYRRQNMWDQLACHAYNIPVPKTWNLDTWRPDVGYAATVAARCNP